MHLGKAPAEVKNCFDIVSVRISGTGRYDTLVVQEHLDLRE
jgi:hypothetical protein